MQGSELLGCITTNYTTEYTPLPFAEYPFLPLFGNFGDIVPLSTSDISG